MHPATAHLQGLASKACSDRTALTPTAASRSACITPASSAPVASCSGKQRKSLQGAKRSAGSAWVPTESRGEELGAWAGTWATAWRTSCSRLVLGPCVDHTARPLRGPHGTATARRACSTWQPCTLRAPQLPRPARVQGSGAAPPTWTAPSRIVSAGWRSSPATMARQAAGDGALRAPCRATHRSSSGSSEESSVGLAQA